MYIYIFFFCLQNIFSRENPHSSCKLNFSVTRASSKPCLPSMLGLSTTGGRRLRQMTVKSEGTRRCDSFMHLPFDRDKLHPSKLTNATLLGRRVGGVGRAGKDSEVGSLSITGSNSKSQRSNISNWNTCHIPRLTTIIVIVIVLLLEAFCLWGQNMTNRDVCWVSSSCAMDPPDALRSWFCHCPFLR